MEFYGLVKRVWDDAVRGTSQFRVWRKLMALQKDLEQLHKVHFPNVLQQKDEVRQELNRVEILLPNDHTNTQLLQSVQTLRKQLIH